MDGEIYERALEDVGDSKPTLVEAVENYIKNNNIRYEIETSFREQIKPKFEYLEVINPAWVHGWESYHTSVNPSCWVYFPSIELVNSLKLSACPQSYDLFGPDGKKFTSYFEYPSPEKKKTERGKPQQTTFFFRRAALERYLRENDLLLFWIATLRSKNMDAWQDEFRTRIWVFPPLRK